MSTLIALSVGCARTWVGVYTLGLAAAVKVARRREIDSDLWEQQWLASRRGESVHGTAGEILTRTLFGIFDDIMWRLETGATTQSKERTLMNNTVPMRIGLLAAMLPLVLLTVAGASFMLGNGDWDNTWEHWLWRASFMACPVIGGYGLWLCATRPRLGMGLALVGVSASAFLMPWMAFVTVPGGIAIMIFAVFRAGFLPRPSSRQPAA